MLPHPCASLPFSTCLFAFSSSALAQVPVVVESTSRDQVGEQLIYFFKEAIRKSASMRLSFDEREIHMEARVVTLDPTAAHTGQSTVYAMATVLHNPASLPAYLDLLVGTCPINQVRSCADSMVASLSKDVDAVVSAFQSSTKPAASGQPGRY